jgi:SepF-like predicted cell division protein (DUF552 family)
LQNQPIYLKAITLRDISDVESIKNDAKKQMILIVRITPMAQKDIEALRKAIDDLYNFVKSTGGDIARLGEERVVITPSAVKIWKGVHDLK